MRSICRVLIILMIAAAATSFFGCSGRNTADTAAAPESEASADSVTDAPEKGEAAELLSVTYSCAGGEDPADVFSYYFREEDGKYLLDAVYTDSEGNSHTGCAEATSDDMNALLRIFDKYGYDRLIGQREKTDPDAEDSGMPTYYFSATYADGRSFKVSSAGDGAAELRELFERIAGKN